MFFVFRPHFLRAQSTMNINLTLGASSEKVPYIFVFGTSLHSYSLEFVNTRGDYQVDED